MSLPQDGPRMAVCRLPLQARAIKPKTESHYETHYAGICDWNIGAVRNNESCACPIERQFTIRSIRFRSRREREPARADRPGAGCRSAGPGGRHAGYLPDQEQVEGLQQGQRAEFANRQRHAIQHGLPEASQIASHIGVRRKEPFLGSLRVGRNVLSRRVGICPNHAARESDWPC